MLPQKKTKDWFTVTPLCYENAQIQTHAPQWIKQPPLSRITNHLLSTSLRTLSNIWTARSTAIIIFGILHLQERNTQLGFAVIVVVVVVVYFLASVFVLKSFVFVQNTTFARLRKPCQLTVWWIPLAKYIFNFKIRFRVDFLKCYVINRSQLTGL